MPDGVDRGGTVASGAVPATKDGDVEEGTVRGPRAKQAAKNRAHNHGMEVRKDIEHVAEEAVEAAAGAKKAAAGVGLRALAGVEEKLEETAEMIGVEIDGNGGVDEDFLEEDEMQLDEGQVAADENNKFHRLTRFFYQPKNQERRRRERKEIAHDMRPVEDRDRFWELQLAIRSMKYVGSVTAIDTFFTVSIVPIDPIKTKSPLRLLPEYSPACILIKNEEKVLDNPFQLWKNKSFKMPYKDLDKYTLDIAMWKISKFTFNTYYGKGSRTLSKIVRQEANMQFAIKEKFTREVEEQRKRKRKLSVPDVAMLGLVVNCEEIFDFQLACENWSLELRDQVAQQRKEEYKTLTFIVPKNSRSDASAGRKCHTATVKWRTDAEKLVWTTLAPRKEPFFFRGTCTALQNSFMIVQVHSSQNMVPGTGKAWGQLIGCALMNLTSILDISVFSGRIKDLQKVKEKFNVGDVNGSIKAIMCSMRMKQPEDIKGGRPRQPKTAATVGHLNPQEQHLVVRIVKCDNLAVADADVGTSDPYIRCTWDNMVQRSPILKETIRPIFNFNFYFPVRLFNNRVKSKKYRDTALRFELESKGDISIQVWDDDDTSADSLGFVRVPLANLLNRKNYAMRTLRGPAVQASDEDVEEEASDTQKQWFEKEKEVRLYDGMKTELIGCPLPNPNTALIFFEAYFYPDWPDHVKLEGTGSHELSDDVWDDLEEAFSKNGHVFSRKYAEPFPDSIGALPSLSEGYQNRETLRRFPSMGLHPQSLMKLPLMAFLCQIYTPEEYTRPGDLMGWINSITFASSSRQERSGIIPQDGWKDPQTFLFTRKGSVQDHALLLCSVLLGAKKDAYICKGTVWAHDTEEVETGRAPRSRLVEHVWVMTREQHDWITFWEPCSRELYHMPNRWTWAKPTKKDGKGKAREKPESAAEEGEPEVGEEDTVVAVEGPISSIVANEIADVLLSQEDIDTLPTVGRIPRPKMKSTTKQVNPRDKMKQEMLKQRAKNKMAPNPKLMEDGNLVEWLPYDSIDVIFNNHNLWANRQNHHPACIRYDLDKDSTEGALPAWEPLLKAEMTAEEKVKYKWTPINQEVVMDPAQPFHAIELREKEMIAEMEENMRLSRGKRGLDTFFERSEKLLRQLDTFLILLDRMRKLDIDFCPWAHQDPAAWTESQRYLLKLRFGTDDEQEMKNNIYNRHGSAFTQSSRYVAYQKETDRAWRKLANQVETTYLNKGGFNGVLRGKVLKGFPVHFSTSDKEEVRGYLTNLPEYQDILTKDSEGTIFTIHCKMFAMLGGVQSFWLYIGVHEPQS
mmetsp:Transcript_70355/g.153301  ORF Transcript_70355/g.153301 Transcript_70355/m.153301 type:complete len:1300 (+) Transcript_70355:110-4009(+)